MTRPVVAYLINQYPKVSHSFIRREVLALERLGFEVHRWASRGWDADCPDPADQAEAKRTRYLLAGGAGSMLAASLTTAWQRPRAFAAALKLSWVCARGSERPWPVHLAYLAQACIALRWSRASGVGHVHAHFGTNPAEVAMLLSELGGPPFSFTVHGPEEFDRPQALHLGRKVQRSAFTVAISSYGRSQLYRWCASADWPRIQVVHCGLDAQFLQQEVCPVPVAPRLVCIGRLCEQKGQLLLVEAVAVLAAQGIGFELVLAGDGEMRAEIEARVRQRGLQDRVRITGWIGGARVLEELRAARAMVLPSFAEGLPVVVMEALALGRPVITTYVAGIPELIRGGESGWLVPAGDVEALTDALRECLATTTAELDRMGAAGRQRVLCRHDADAEARKLGELFSGSPGSSPRVASEPEVSAA